MKFIFSSATLSYPKLLDVYLLERKPHQETLKSFTLRTVTIGLISFSLEGWCIVPDSDFSLCRSNGASVSQNPPEGSVSVSRICTATARLVSESLQSSGRGLGGIFICPGKFSSLQSLALYQAHSCAFNHSAELVQTASILSPLLKVQKLNLNVNVRSLVFPLSAVVAFS